MAPARGRRAPVQEFHARTSDPRPRDSSAEALARVSNFAGQRAGRDRRGGGQEYLGLLMPHSTGEISIGGADALQGRVHTPKSVDRSPQAGGATRVLGYLGSRRDQNIP